MHKHNLQLSICKVSTQTSSPRPASRRSSHAPCPHRISRPMPASHLTHSVPFLSSASVRNRASPSRAYTRNCGQRLSPRPNGRTATPCSPACLWMHATEASAALRHLHTNHGGALAVAVGRQRPATPDLHLKHSDETFATLVYKQ